MSSLAQLHQDYGNAYQAFQQKQHPGLRLPTRSNCYLIFPLGVSGTHFAAGLLAKDQKLQFYLLLQGKHCETWFTSLVSDKTRIENVLHEKPVWSPRKNSNRTRVTVYLTVNDFDDRLDWQRQHNWIFQQSTRFKEAFRDRLHDLKGTL
jgi:hypothetical protein